MNPCCMDLPGAMSCHRTPALWHQHWIAIKVNAVPSSLTMPPKHSRRAMTAFGSRKTLLPGS